MQLRKLARRWQVQRSSFTTDYQPVLTELFAEHRSNVQDRAHWTSASSQHTARALSSWVVIPADHCPSRGHVICPSLFSMLMHKTFCTGEVFALRRESAASFRAEVVTMIPARLQHRYALGLRPHAPLPTRLAFFPNRPKTGSKRDQLFPSSAHGQHPSSRSSAPFSLSSPRSAFSSGASTAALGCSIA